MPKSEKGVTNDKINIIKENMNSKASLKVK